MLVGWIQDIWLNVALKELKYKPSPPTIKVSILKLKKMVRDIYIIKQIENLTNQDICKYT